MELLRLQGVRTAYGCVTLPNEKSEGLHRALGFRQLGVYRNTGYKCGAWHDVAWFEKALGPYGGARSPVRPFPAVPEEAVRAVLAAF